MNLKNYFASFSILSCRTIAIIFTIGLFTESIFGEEIFVYDSKGKRNPFLALVTEQGVIISIAEDLTAGEMILEGIIYDPRGNSLAIINGAVLKMGDRFGGYSVVEIAQDRVILLKGNERFSLELKKEE